MTERKMGLGEAYGRAVFALVRLAQEQAERLEGKTELSGADCRALADLAQALATLTRDFKSQASPLALAADFLQPGPRP